MKRNELSGDEFKQLLLACATLPFIEQSRGTTDYVLDVMETVLNFHMQEPAVLSALNFFRNEVQHQHDIYEHCELEQVLNAYVDNQEGNQQASRFLWGNRHWTRVALLRRLMEFFTSVGINDQESLRQWARKAEFGDFAGKVKGLGIAVYHWLLIRCGVDSIKPDVWLLNFAERVTGRRLSEHALVAAFQDIAPMLGVSLTTLDVTIWYYEKLAMATQDVPAMRIVAWQLLKRGLERELRQGSLGDLGWRVELDERERLYYDQAGLTMTAERSLFGDGCPGETVVMLRQLQWSEGFGLSMVVRHETALAQDLFEQIKEKLGEDWTVCNDLVFSASFYFEKGLMIGSRVTVTGVSEWMADMVMHTCASITICSKSGKNGNSDVVATA